MAAPEPDPTASIHKLAMDLFEATMASLRVQLRYNPERDAICARMPAPLLEIREANRRAQSAVSTARLDLKEAVENDRWYGEWGQRFAHTRDNAQDDLPALREVLIKELEQRHALLDEQAEAAIQAEQGIQNEWSAAENKLTKEWHEEHAPRLAALIAAFQPEFERHRERIAGFVDLKELKLGNLAEDASTAFQVLLTFAGRVLHFRTRSCDGLDPDQLKVAVEQEAGWIARQEWEERRAWIGRSVEAEAVARLRTQGGANSDEKAAAEGAAAVGGIDTWEPSAHQELVLAVLKRDGRLQTRHLWERISPKYVDLRAHQNAMRDMVQHKKVLKVGKGRATEYWLP